MNKTGYIFHPQYLKHDTQSHPENSGRLRAIQDRIKSSEIYPHLHFPEPRFATDDELKKNHDLDYINHVRNSCQNGTQNLDGDTVICSESWDAAILSAGAGLTAVDKIISGELDNAFAAVRPPGHHAEKDKAMGFCIYNNVAVGANYLIEKYKYNKVAIIDFDVHHGNGTQDIFYDNEKVLYISTHQYPYYPGSGSEKETGKFNNILNIPLEAGTSAEQYLNAYENVLKKLKEFKPEFVLFSAGFDAHIDDPLAQLRLSSEDFYHITKRTLEVSKSICNGNVVSILEGGYDLKALQDSTKRHVDALIEFN